MDKGQLVFGIVGLILISIFLLLVGGQSADNGKQLKSMNYTIEQMNQTMFQGREVGNVRGNVTLEAIQVVLDKQVANEKNILGNLTDHRRVANYTRDQVLGLINTVEHQANQSYQNQETYFKPYFNETFQKIFKALNITETGSNYTLPR